MSGVTIDLELLPPLFKGLTVTIQIFSGAAGVAVVAALGGGLGRLSGRCWIKAPATCYIEVFRGTSALVQLYWVFYVLPFFGIEIGAMAAGILVLGLNAGSYGAEIVRGSILAVPRGQIEAAIALNLTPFQRMWRIVLPQAAAAMIPPATNTLIELLKNTSLVSLITIADLTFQGQIIRASTLKSAEVFLLLLALYLALSMVIRTFMSRIEKRYSLSWRPVGGLT